MSATPIDFAGTLTQTPVVMNGAMYFTATDSAHGTELWKSNGTTQGTALLKDINPGPNPSNPAYLTVVGNTLYFAASDGVHGSELWKSDGTASRNHDGHRYFRWVRQLFSPISH